MMKCLNVNQFVINLQQIFLYMVQETFNSPKVIIHTQLQLNALALAPNLVWSHQMTAEHDALSIWFLFKWLNVCVCVCVVDWLAASLFGLFNRSTVMEYIYLICIQLAFACENLLHIQIHSHTHTLFTDVLCQLFRSQLSFYTCFLFLLLFIFLFICLEFKNYYRFVCLYLFFNSICTNNAREMGEKLNMKNK